MLDIMSKKGESKANGNGEYLPRAPKLTLGQKAADILTNFAGSWFFIGFLFLYIASWASVNSWLLVSKPLDPYPYILLNLTLSCVAAIQGPIILMSQKRLGERDRLQAKYDYLVDRKSEREIQELQRELKRTQQMIMRLRSK